MEWKRSSRCGAGECVQVATVGKVKPTVLVRSSNDPGTVLVFSAEEWRNFVAGVEAGEFRV